MDVGSVGAGSRAAQARRAGFVGDPRIAGDATIHDTRRATEGTTAALLPVMSFRKSRGSWLTLAGLAATVVGLGALTGCSAPPSLGSSGADGSVGRRSEAVVVDYYKGKTKVRSCAATLLSSSVVVAPAHCADGTTKAVVEVLDSKKTRTSVSRVYTYDWVSADPSMVRSQRHDVALLVLRKAVAKARFARIQSAACAGCRVVQVGRTRDGGTRVLGLSKRLRLSRIAGGFRVPVAASKVTRRGGALYRVTKKDERVIVGIVVGHTKKSGQGVVVPLTDPVMQKWIRAVVKTEGNLTLSKTSSALSTKNLRFLDEEPETGSQEPETEEPSSNEGTQEETVEDERPQEEQASDPAPEEDTASENEGSEPVVEEPSSEEQPASDEQPTSNEGERPSSEENGTPNVQDANNETPTQDTTTEAPSEPTEDPSDPVVPTGENREEPQSSPDRDAAQPASSEPGAYEDAQAAANTETPTNAGEGTDPPSMGNLRASGNDTNPPYPGNIPGVGALRAPAGDEETTHHPGGNSVTVATPGDSAFTDDAQLAQRYQGVANLYNSHGTPGTLVGGVPTDTVRRFMQDDKPLIVASCFSGAPMSGGSTIRRMASTYGGDPERIYGCSGYASGDDQSGLGCTGTWVNGNGRAVPPEERQRLGLNQYQCSRNTMNDEGRPVWSDCVVKN